MAGYVLGSHASNGSTAGEPARRRRRVVAVVAVVSVLALGAAAVATGAAVSSNSSSPASAVNTANTILSQAVAATRRAGTFHYVAKSQGGNTNQTTVGVAGRDSGRQQITVHSAAFGIERFSLVLVDGVVYFRGNAASLQDQLSVTSAATAASHAQRWISVQRSDGPYAALAAGITAGSALSEITIDPQHAAQVRTAGRQLWRLTGSLGSQAGQTASGSARLDVGGRTKLPASYSATASSGGQQARSGFTFSHWGTTVTVAAPPGSVPYADFRGDVGQLGAAPSPSFSHLTPLRQ